MSASVLVNRGIKSWYWQGTSFIESSLVSVSAVKANIYTTASGNLAVYRKADRDMRAILWLDSLGGSADIWRIGRQTGLAVSRREGKGVLGPLDLRIVSF